MGLSNDENTPSGGTDGVRVGEISLAFKNGIPSSFQEQMSKALEEKRWSQDPIPPPASTDPHSGAEMEKVTPKDVHPELLHDLISMACLSDWAPP